MAKNKLKLKPEENGHFYASSVAEWRVSNDAEDLIKKMKGYSYPFVLIWVPLPLEAQYKIEGYVPAVEGCIRLGQYFIDND